MLGRKRVGREKGGDVADMCMCAQQGAKVLVESTGRQLALSWAALGQSFESQNCGANTAITMAL